MIVKSWFIVLVEVVAKMTISRYKNKDKFKFTLEIENLFHWFFKYNDIEFEFVMVPSVHPLISPIIDFKKIYKNHVKML